MDRRYSVRIKAYGLDLKNINDVYQKQKMRFPNNSGYRYHFYYDPETKLVHVSKFYSTDILIGEFNTLFFDQGGNAKHVLIGMIHGAIEERSSKNEG